MINEIIESIKKQLIVFDVYVDGIKLFTSSKNNAADLVDNKLKQKKFQSKDVIVYRIINGKQEDVTNLFKKT